MYVIYATVAYCRMLFTKIVFELLQDFLYLPVQLAHIALNNLTQYTAEELVALLKQNNTAAFTEIYNRYWQKLFAIAYNRLKETETAEDLLHDVFTALWANRHIIEINILENYLATATKYMVLARFQKKAREREYNNSLHSTPVIDVPIETALHYKCILELAMQKVESLPERCKLIFKYSRNEGMPVKQIAEKLNISVKTVENQLTKALKSIKSAAKMLLGILFFICR